MREPVSRIRTRRMLVGVVFAVVSCGGGGAGPANDDDEALNFVEEELVGLWSRYHSFDGSTEYYRFEGNRTACNWEEEDGSSWRTSENTYPSWTASATETSPGSGEYLVTNTNAGITLTFDYARNFFYPTGFPDLKFYPSSEGKGCE